jgi:hypothetical protein
MTNVLAIFLMSFAIVSCGVKTTSEVDKVKSDTRAMTEGLFSKNGLKCTFLGTDGTSKDFFLSHNEKDGTKSLSFHDYLETGKIKLIGATLAGSLFLSINIENSMIDGSEVRQGSTTVTNMDVEGLVLDGKPMLVTLKISLNESNDGIIQRRILLLKDDNTTENVSEEIGQVKYCTQSKADWG